MLSYPSSLTSMYLLPVSLFSWAKGNRGEDLIVIVTSFALLWEQSLWASQNTGVIDGSEARQSSLLLGSAWSVTDWIVEEAYAETETTHKAFISWAFVSNTSAREGQGMKQLGAEERLGCEAIPEPALANLHSAEADVILPG